VSGAQQDNSDVRIAGPGVLESAQPEPSDLTGGRDRSASRPVKIIRPPSLSLTHMGRLLRELLDYRDLIWTLSIHRLRVRYKQSSLGWAWAVLQPLSLMLIYTVIFSVVTRMPSDGVPYALFVYTALLPWTYFSTVVTTSATSLVSHSQLITKVYFPREILPVTYVIAGIVDFLVAAVLLGGMMFYYRVHLTWLALWVIPALIVITAFSATLALILSALQVRMRDIGLAMPLLMQLWMFATPVVYPLSAVPERFRGLYILNPLAGAIETFRRVLLQNRPPDTGSFEVAAIISFVLLPASYMFFKHRESSMADII
jgi:homopolymeric O-antigen transport system permease protein